MLEGNAEASFKRAVFITENAYLSGQLDYEEYLRQIKFLAYLTSRVVKDGAQLDYAENDLEDVRKKFAVYHIMKDTIPFLMELAKDSSLILKTEPFGYDFKDFFGEHDWTKMFVTKLLQTHSGNCHSLPFLYKIIAEEIGTDAHLAMAPNHTYIKQWTDKTGWFNTELTSGQFPIDSWIMASGYIKLEAIQNRVFMDTLSLTQSIAVSLTDLALGYERKFGRANNSNFLNKCLDLALEHYPNYINALILRAEIAKSEYSDLMRDQSAESPSDLWYDPALKRQFELLQERYIHIHRLGYRQMPKEMYLNWLMDIEEKDTDKSLERFQFDSPQPFKDYGYKMKVSTLSNGKYPEFFDQDSIIQIGTVVLNRLNGQLRAFIEYDTLYSEATLEPEVISKWLSPDPLAEEFYSHSPYNFALNNPIRYNDPDGLAPQDPNDRSKRQKEAEASFAMAHPQAALRIGSYKPGSGNISTAAGNFAINSGLGDRPTNEGGQRNALRHGIWQAMITQEFGKDIASAAGFAHEGFSVPEAKATATGYNISGMGSEFLAEADALADLLNNTIGQEIGENNPNATNVGISKLVLTEFYENGLWTVQETETSYTITKTKLTTEEYEAALSNLQPLRETGLKEDK